MFRGPDVPIELPSLGLAIYAAPKVLTTSLKTLAFHLENGRPFEPFTLDGRPANVHRLSPTKPFTAPDRALFPVVVAFVRDPVERLKSAYRNRVLRRHGQSRPLWRRAVEDGLPSDPNFDEFVHLLDGYRRAIGEIDHHTAPQVRFLGHSPQVFDRVFDFGEVARFESLISDLVGVEVRLPHEQRSGRSSLDPSPGTLQRIRDLFADDYAAFGAFFGGRPDADRASITGGGGPACD